MDEILLLETSQNQYYWLLFELISKMISNWCTVYLPLWCCHRSLIHSTHALHPGLMWPSFWTLLTCCDGTSPYKLLSQGSNPQHASVPQPFTHPGLPLEYFFAMTPDRPGCLDLGLHAHYRRPGSQFNANQLQPSPNETNVASCTLGTFNCTVWLQLGLIQVIYCIGRRQHHLCWKSGIVQPVLGWLSRLFPLKPVSRSMKLSVFRRTDIAVTKWHNWH